MKAPSYFQGISFIQLIECIFATLVGIIMCLIWRLLSLLKNRAGECACTAYVTFKDAYALETAVLLSVSCSEMSLGRK